MGRHQPVVGRDTRERAVILGQQRPDRDRRDRRPLECSRHQKIADGRLVTAPQLHSDVDGAGQRHGPVDPRAHLPCSTIPFFAGREQV